MDYVREGHNCGDDEGDAKREDTNSQIHK